MQQLEEEAQPMKRTLNPIVTGTSVLGLKYKDGVLMAADTLASYGSLARFLDVSRLLRVGQYTVVGASGDISDFQSLEHTLEDLVIENKTADDGHELYPHHIYEFLGRVLYQRRSKMNPLWNTLVVGGYRNGKSFLGHVDLRGTMFEASTIATGFGAHLAQPILRKAIEGREHEITYEEAKAVMEDCMRVLYYRDARSLNKYQIANITAAGIAISEPYSVSANWGYASTIRGYA